ncbi:MAG: PQQ-binding-like beta-propeller repeat protein [Armatimonadota bacterium]|nr:hypothetical protein [bacterium]
MSNFTRVLQAIAIMCGVIAAQIPADAAAQLYAGNRKQINCGVAWISSSGASQPVGSGYDNNGNIGLTGGVGNLFYLLDNITSMKPAAWSLENPFAGVDTSGTMPRKYNKSDPLYWKVNLSAVRDLSRMHVLYLPAQSAIKLSDEIRETLRKFVDGGGVLWIDNSSASSPMSFSSDGEFIFPNFDFHNTSQGVDYAKNRHHPLLTIPFWLTEQDIAMLGPSDFWGKIYVNPGWMQGTDLIPPSIDSDMTVFDYLFSVVVNTGSMSAMPSVASNAYGSGWIVATSNYIGRGCFMTYPYNLPSLKFAYNLLAMSSTWTNVRKDPRHSGGSIDTVGGTKLAKIWSYSDAAPMSGESAPVVYKNVVFYSSGSTLYALDLKPQEDLDNNGNADDGQQDTGTIGGQDIIWQDEPGGTLSSPTVVTLQLPTGTSKIGDSIDAVLVLSSTGQIYMYDAFPDVNGILDSSNSPLAGCTFNCNTPEELTNPAPPICINGWIYVLRSDGKIYAVNPVLKIKNAPVYTWLFPSDSAGSSYKAEPRTGLSFGYVSAQNNGGVVGMLCWGTVAPSIGGGTVTEKNDAVFGVPINAKNDFLTNQNFSGTRVDCKVTLIGRAQIASTPAPVVRGYYTDGSGNKKTLTITNVEPNTNINGATSYGYMRITASSTIPSNAIFRADYTLDYSNETVLTNSIASIRKTLDPQPPTNSPGNAVNVVIPASPALGPDAMVYISGKREGSITTEPTPGGYLYGLQIDGQDQKTKWPYFLHAGVTSSWLAGSSDSVLSTAAGTGVTMQSNLALPGVVMIENNDVWTPLQNPQVLSSPAYSADKVFATVTGTNGGALMCFKAKPDFVIRLCENAGFDMAGKPIRQPMSLYDSTTKRNRSVRIWQPNLLLDSPLTMTANIAVLLKDESMIDRDKGTITISDFDDLSVPGINGITNVFSPSLPVWVMVDSIEIPIDYSTWGPLSTYKTVTPVTGDCVDLSGWNNMLWYYPVEDSIHSSPVVIGETVYFETDNGTLYALPTETGKSGGVPIDDEDVIWKETSDNNLNSGTSSTNVSIAGSNGVLVIPKGDGLYAYSNTTTLVADTNRLMELDGAGELSWAADSIIWPVHTPPSISQQPATTSGPVDKPNRVRYVSTSELLVANSGANQVCRIDKSGQVGSLRVSDIDGNLRYIRWLYDRFSDPNRLLRPGQTRRLVGPTDAILWEETETDATYGSVQVVHCLIADSGNHRIVDLVYKFDIDSNARYLIADDNDIDSESGFCMPRLNWVTTMDSTGQDYVFDCIQIVPNYTSGAISSFEIWAAISNYRTGLGDTVTDQGLGGAIVAIGYREIDGNSYNYNFDNSGRIIYGCDRVKINNKEVPLASPRYFQVTDTNAGRYMYVCDNYGVYKALIPTTSGAVPVVDPKQILTDTDYRSLDRDGDNTNNTPDKQILNVPLEASCVHVLPNGNWLITNSYSGVNKSRTSKFSGEVFEYNPNATSTSDKKVEWQSPDLDWTFKGGSTSVYSWKQVIDNGQIMQQPTCGYRQF